MEGTVKWFSFDKGFGFVTGDDGNDYFVHHTQVPEGMRLREGDSISFDPAETDRGAQARNVRAPGAAPAKKAAAPAGADEEPAEEDADEAPEESDGQESDEEPAEEDSGDADEDDGSDGEKDE